MIRKDIGVDPAKRERLLALATQLGRSASELAREGIETVLTLAEAQQRTIDQLRKQSDEGLERKP